MQRIVFLFFVAAAVGAICAGGCKQGRQDGQPGTTEAGPPPVEEIEVLCGGSFRYPLEKLAEQFEKETGCRAVLVFGQSEDHLPKIKMHVVGDVFVSHDPFVQYTKDAGALSDYVQVGFVAPVLVVKKGNPKKLTKFEDLAQPGLRVVLTNPDFSTCGEMIWALLEKKKIKDAVLANVGNAQVRSHAEVATKIKLNHRDAGIMWNGVAHNWLDAVEIVPGPYEYDQDIRVAVMGLSYSKKKDLVEKFLEFSKKHGKEIFTEFGYVK